MQLSEINNDYRDTTRQFTGSTAREDGNPRQDTPTRTEHLGFTEDTGRPVGLLTYDLQATAK